jgi:hypothetical protein
MLIASSQCAADTITQTIGLVGSDEPSWLEHFRLFPNPNKGVFSVEMKGEPQPELAFVLLNQMGQIVGRQTLGFQTGNLLHTFDFGDLPPGVYSLKMQAEHEAKCWKLMVK